MTTAATAPEPPATTRPAAPLLEIRDLAVSFRREQGGFEPAVSHVSLTLHANQTLAVVGESGSGKSVTALSVLRLLPESHSRYDKGSIILTPGDAPQDVLTLGRRALARVRGRHAAMIFQEPMTSLNPVYSIGDQIIEAITLHTDLDHAQARRRAADALTEVGIRDAASRLDDYPHQFSGGMRQRVMIAMALACQPRILLADEPTTALDVTVQAQILALLRQLQRSRGMGVLLITHALGVVAEQADAVCVMYAGRVVEFGPVRDLFENPLHPYTRGLLRSIPRIRERRERLVTVRDVVDDPSQFAPVGPADAPLVPWWPAHRPPAGHTPVPGPAGDSALVEIAPRRWLCVWRTTSVRPRMLTQPAVPPTQR
ncbi:MAG: ABC transporter ATP-binding protein [Planctomycetota bacterium]|nr:ABC transporter ATP-binding protein [Planctomycetota bacterium]